MKRFATVLAFLVAASSIAQETKTIEIAEIRVQRRDPVEFAWGEENDKDELTYGINPDGTASLWVGTKDGSKKIVDPDALTVVKPQRLDKSAFVVYPVQPNDSTMPVIQTGDNKFSPWNYISGSTTNYVGKPGVTGQVRTIKVRTVDPQLKITAVQWAWTNRASNCASTTIRDESEGLFLPEHELRLDSGYMNMNDTPSGGDITITEVYGYYGDKTKSEIDASVVDITVYEQDGRSYTLGRVHHMIESIHYKQDRWSYYPAAHDVNVDDKTLYLDHDHFSLVKSDGALGGYIGSDVGRLISWDRGNQDGGTLIKGFEVNTNGTVYVYVTTKFGGTLTVMRSDTAGGPFTNVATTNDGIVDWNGGQAYRLSAPQTSGAAGFYKVYATIAPEDLRGPSVTIHPDTIKFGSNEVELQLIEITIGNTTLEVLGRVKP